MESNYIKHLETLSSNGTQMSLHMDEVLSDVEKLHIDFELNPNSLKPDAISLLDKTADEFALFIKHIVHLTDETSIRKGELSLRILKLCLILQSKIANFHNRKAKFFLLN